MRSKLALFLLLAFVAGALVAGCGGDDSEGTAAGGSGVAGSDSSDGSSDGGDSGAGQPVTTSELTKAQYVKQANAVCKRHTESRRDDLNAFSEEERETPEGERIDNLLKQIYVPTMTAETEDLRELGAPEGDEQQVEKIISAFEGWVEAIESTEDASKDPAVEKTIERAAALARKYGLEECTYG